MELATSAGPMMLRNLACLVEDGNKSQGFTLGRPIMTVLSYPANVLLVRARDTKSEWELGDTEQAVVETTAIQLLCQMKTSVRDIALDTMTLEGLVDISSPANQDWNDNNSVHGGGNSQDTILKTENLMHVY
ncbi:hypothetical protein PR001_g430 [Phytophthora rubi]|uniref:Uncharacterized protein n=2 Tax=Phytophthora rubi TaxID=129364 RepID=A0A6A3P3E7_9STRA|nr:hypothetical protein PR001_g430 [Phytophthora rubi]